MKRRHLLTGAGVAAAAALAGCTANDNTDDSNPEGTPDEEGEPNTEDPTPSEPDNSDEAPDDMVTFAEPALSKLVLKCSADSTVPEDHLPSIGPWPTNLVVVGQFALENEENIYPKMVDVEQDANAETITITTGFTDEVPEGYDSFEEQTEVGVDRCGYQHVDFTFGLDVAEDSDPIDEGTDIQWVVEYPDGTVEEVASAASV